MKKLIILTTLSLLIFTVAFSQDKKIKRITTTTFEATSKFGEVVRGKKISSYVDEFNKDGKIIEDRFYIYTYNKSGLKIKEDGGDGDYKIFKYDNDGKEVELDYYYNNTLSFKTKSKYNNQNLKIERVSYNSDGTFDEKLTYKYNSKNNILEMQIFNSNDKMIGLTKYKYDINQNLIEVNAIINNVVIFSAKRIFNGKQMVKEKSFRVRRGEKTVTHFTNTKFDKNNNWVESVSYDEQQNATEMTIRLIEYWN